MHRLHCLLAGGGGGGGLLQRQTMQFQLPHREIWLSFTHQCEQLIKLGLCWAYAEALEFHTQLIRFKKIARGQGAQGVP